MSDRNDTIHAIRTELNRRSVKRWSVTGGRGTAWGWITITSPPSRQDRGILTDADRTELAELLGLDSVHHQGVSIASSSAHYAEYVARAKGETPERIAQPYWD